MPNRHLVSPALRILSLGAGVQSSTILLMACQGEFSKHLDGAIFADTHWESDRTYSWLNYLKEHALMAEIPVYVVSAGDLRQDVLDARGRQTLSKVANPPFYVIDNNPSPNGAPDRGGRLWRGCTRDYKINPIEKKIRALLGIKKGARVPRGVVVEQWFGISTDEFQRVRTNKHKWVVNYYPLIERRMSRQDCLSWINKNGHPVPPKSACIGCPNRSNGGWAAMKRDNPKGFKAAAEFDATLRTGEKLPGVTGEVYLHRRMRPLPEAVEMGIDNRQEEMDLCEEGHCWT